MTRPSTHTEAPVELPPAKPPFWKAPFWRTTAGSLVIVAAVIGVFGGAVGMGLLLRQQRHADLQVTVTSCTFAGSTATVGYTITNTGGSAHDVTLHIEYRDASGARVDTDTSYAHVPARDTVRGSESTFLDAPTDDGRCHVTY